MLKLRKFTALVLLATLALGLAAGCGLAPTAPVINQQASTIQSSRVAESNGLMSTTTSILGGLLKLVFRVLDVVGSLGGSLSNGRWTVNVPAGAFDGTATVRLGVQSLLSPTCQLEISPADKNHFTVPVQLTASCPGVSSDVLRNYVILWYNPDTAAWTPVAGSTVDLVNHTVSAPLQHFSNYAVGPADGKAGW
jgi:hypothetical protein